MKTVTERLRFFILIQCLQTGALVDSSSLSSAMLSISYMAGDQAILPCSWKSHLGEAALPVCHVQWVTPSDTVFEQRGNDKWQAPEFEGRVRVPEEKLGSGNCSLIISDVQLGDTGRYDSFMVVDGKRSKRTRVFIQGVRLLVSDHKSYQVHQPGEDMVLQLYTRHSVRVVFQARNDSEWSDLWMRGDNNSQRLEKHLLLEQLTVKRLEPSDEGIYKVLDQHGLAVSTVQLSVDARARADRRVQETLEYVPTDVAAKSSCSALLTLAVLVLSFQTLQLL
ncbi:uncharacterized protein igldcp [Oreochromis niloticus]|uniref:uncharacterized protein igldcp n=1 Tax=Oreochromis niloticus TaxID=8128 RepID=UPI00022B284C|nr:uncharacterized protein LOC100700068 [Oreochromis niloticus]CAI5692107.1 unnamed protein product [Mustela putorius furo]